MSFTFELIITLLFVSLTRDVTCLHVSGVWSPSADMMKVIARFGVQKSDIHHKDDTFGYVFGNVSLIRKHHDESKLHYATLVLADRSMFMHLDMLYQNMNRHAQINKTEMCGKLFTVIDDVAYDERCNDAKEKDLIRYVPCGKDRLCDGAMVSSKIVADYQFTYVIEDLRQPTFWFLLLIACHRGIDPNSSYGAFQGNDTCQWRDGSEDTSVMKYDIWLVNGHPSGAMNKPLDFDHQFSFEHQDILLYITLLILYIVLTAAQLYAFSTQKVRNILTYLFTSSLSMHCLSFFFICLHKIVFAHDGEGFETLAIVADVIKILSIALFILFVLIIGKGWPITRRSVSAKPLLFIVWFLYISIEFILFVWIKYSVDIIKEVDEYHTVPGWISLTFRVSLMLWFLYELRRTMMIEQHQRKLKFYLHFGAGILVWFVHLPLVAFVALQIGLMWRYKLITGFSSAADFLAYAIVTHLFWPTRQSQQFLTRQSDIDYTEELDYYDDGVQQNEATHFTNPHYKGYRNPNGYAYDNQVIDNDIKS